MEEGNRMAELSYTQPLDVGDMVALLHHAADVDVPIVGISRVDADPYVVGPVITVTIGEIGTISEDGYRTDGIRPFVTFAERLGVQEVLITPLREGCYWTRAFGSVGTIAVEFQTARSDYPLLRDLFEANQPIPEEQDPAEPSVMLPLAQLAAALDAATTKEDTTP
jgi:hypothetical protein